MKYIKDYREGDRVFDIYLCKHKQEAVTKNGKPYESVILQDKTGTIDAKVWEPNNPGIGDYDDLDYIEVYGDVTNFQGQLQISVRCMRTRMTMMNTMSMKRSHSKNTILPIICR